MRGIKADNVRTFLFFCEIMIPKAAANYNSKCMTHVIISLLA
jgi:hypothetical protein